MNDDNYNYVIADSSRLFWRFFFLHIDFMLFLLLLLFWLKHLTQFEAACWLCREVFKYNCLDDILIHSNVHLSSSMVCLNRVATESLIFHRHKVLFVIIPGGEKQVSGDRQVRPALNYWLNSVTHTHYVVSTDKEIDIWTQMEKYARRHTGLHGFGGV